MRKWLLFATAATSLSVVSSAHAGIIISIEESGSDVLFTTSGSLNTTGLTGHSDTTNIRSVSYNNGPSSFRTWIAFGGGSQDFFSGDGNGLSGYTSDVSWTGGSAGGLGVDLLSGLANFGFRTGAYHDIWIPDNYVSGTTVTQVLRRSNASLASLGLNAGDYAEVSWTGAGGGSGDSIRMQVVGASAVPEPSSLALLAGGMIVMAGNCLRRRRRRGDQLAHSVQ